MTSFTGDARPDSSCEVCGNNSGQCFEIRLGGESHIFDSFECAMIALSPNCGYCGSRIVGHSIVLGNTVYCSYQCANDDNARQYEAQIRLQEQAQF